MASAIGLAVILVVIAGGWYWYRAHKAKKAPTFVGSGSGGTPPTPPAKLK